MECQYLTLPKNNKFPELKLRILYEGVASGIFCSLSKAEIIDTGMTVALKNSRTPLSDDVSAALGDVSYVPRTLYREERAPYVIVEEWVEGVTLFDLAEKDGVRDPQFLKVGHLLLDTLCDAYYKRGVYHGDLTPSNILWSEESGAKRLHLIDFDPWYPVNEDGYVSAPDISGSIPFLPPEYIFGDTTFDGSKAMTYCAGAVLFFVRYGRPPYCEGFAKSVVRRLMFGPSGESSADEEKIQRTDFHNWKKHLHGCMHNALELYTREGNKALGMMLSMDPSLRPDLKDTAAILNNGFTN